MKRSEFINYMSNYLQKYENIFNGYKNKSISLKCACDNLAMYITKELEEFKQFQPTYTTDSHEGHFTYTHKGWEPEDVN